MDLTNKVAVVTGAAGGMGVATSRRLAELGATVFGCDVDVERGERAFASLDGDTRFLPLDVTDPASWDGVATRIAAEFGGIDVAHLNAGVMTRPRGVAALTDPMEWLTIEGYERTMGVNARGSFLGLIALLPHVAARHGDIIATASIAGITPMSFDPLYAMSKHAVVGLLTSVASVVEAQGVRINVICPGGVDTDMAPPDIRERVGAQLQPASFIADVVVQVLESGSSGGVWVAMTPEPGGVWRQAPAVLTPPDDSA